MKMKKKKKLYSLTEEHKAQIPAWTKRWIDNAMSTKPMTTEDREICKDAVKRLYEAAGKTPPPPHRIVFVPSPFVLRFAGGFAAAIWYKRKNGINSHTATRAVTDAATRDATNCCHL
jgi:hypothetical protein